MGNGVMMWGVLGGREREAHSRTHPAATASRALSLQSTAPAEEKASDWRFLSVTHTLRPNLR